MPKRILYVIPSIQYGGAELQTITQINYLYQKDFCIQLLVLNQLDTGLRDTILLPDAQIKALKFPFDYLNYKTIKHTYHFLFDISKWIKKQQIDLVVAHLPLSHFVMRQVYISSKLLFKNKFKLLTYHHSMQYEANPLDTFSKKLFNHFSSFLARIADQQTICVSKAVQQNIAAHLYLSPTSILPNGVPFLSINDKLAKQYLSQQSLLRKSFLMVLPGRLHPSKGHLFFLKAFQKIIAQNHWKAQDIGLLIVGGGLLESSIRQAIDDLQLHEFCHITGFVPNETLLSFYKIADLVVIPSINEGFGIVAIEALMQESLILCSNAGGLKEIIHDRQNGFIFDKLNEKDLLKKLLFVYQNRHKTLIAKDLLLKDYKNRFSLEKQMSQLIHILTDD